MGQNQTRSGTHQKQPKHVRKAIHSNGFCNLKSPCFGYRPENEPVADDNNMTWKQHLLEQLQYVDGEEWPQILVDFLQDNNTEAQDVVFQSDIFWADFNAAKKPVHYTTKPIGLAGSARKSGSINESTYQPEEKFLHSNQFASVDDTNVAKDQPANNKKDLTQDIKNIIAASDILEEKVFGTNDNEAWMQRSFNIKPTEDTIKSRAASIEHFRFNMGLTGSKVDPLHPLGTRFSHQPFEESKQLTIPRENFRDSIRSVDNDQVVTVSRNSVVAVERYENNTFIVQQPPVERENTKPKSHDSSRLNLSSRDEGMESENASMTSLTEEEKLYRTVLNYKTLTGIIDKHLRQKTNVFCTLIELFEEFFVKAYGDVNNQVKTGNMLLSEVKGYIQKATKDLQQFIRIMFEGVNIFYKLDKLKIGRKMTTGTLFNRNNMLNFVTSIIFNKKIHDTIFKLYQIEALPIEDTYEKSLKRCQTLPPQDFGIPPEFCLNEKTIQYFKDKNLLQSIGNPLNYLSESSYFEESGLASSQESRDTQPEIKLNTAPKSQINGIHQLNNKDTSKSYKKAIDFLKNLEHRRSPIHKLKTIVKVAENITLSIENFYKEAGVPNTKRLDADQTLAVFMYILAKSGLTDVTTHCKIIENFTTNNVLDSVSGYYATTLEACVNCICSISLESGVSQEDGISPTSGDFNQYSSMPSWVGNNKKFNEAGSMI